MLIIYSGHNKGIHERSTGIMYVLEVVLVFHRMFSLACPMVPWTVHPRFFSAPKVISCQEVVEIKDIMA